MKESWRYYDFLRRWGLLLIIGIALGTVAGFGIYTIQVGPSLFTAKARVLVAGVTLSIVSREYQDPQEAVTSLVVKGRQINKATKGGIETDIDQFTIAGRYPAPLWKPILMGSIVGGLLALGAGYIWDDAAAYRRHRQKIKSKDS